MFLFEDGFFVGSFASLGVELRFQNSFDQNDRHGFERECPCAFEYALFVNDECLMERRGRCCENAAGAIGGRVVYFELGHDRLRLVGTCEK